MLKDRYGAALHVDDKVRIVKMPDGMSDHLPPKEKVFVDRCEGEIGIVDEFPDPDHAMVEMYDPVGKMSHSFYVPIVDLEKQI